MAFEPELSMRLTGGTKRTQNPGLTAVLNAKPDESHISSVAVTLPPSEILDNAHIRNVCTRVQFAAEQCPAGSLIGHAVAETPLLEDPLQGPVYLRSAPENKSGLPDVVASLKGQIDIDLDGKVDTVNDGLRTTFATVPDAPVSKFTLSLDAGNKSLLQNETNICQAPQSRSRGSTARTAEMPTRRPKSRLRAGARRSTTVTPAARSAGIGNGKHEERDREDGDRESDKSVAAQGRPGRAVHCGFCHRPRRAIGVRETHDQLEDQRLLRRLQCGDQQQRQRLGDRSGRGDEINPGNEGIYEYNPLPSQTRLAVPNTYSSLGYYIFDLTAAVDDANEEVFVAQSNGRQVEIFTPTSASSPCEEIKSTKTPEPYCYTHQWTRINSANSCFNCLPDLHIAIDNSGTFSEGRVYLSLTSPENDVEMFDADQRPVDFPATTSYITNNKLTGTPSGRFGEVANVAVDSHGNLYVTDVGKSVVDEFDSSGTFVARLPGRGRPAGVPRHRRSGVDPTNGNVLITRLAGGQRIRRIGQSPRDADVGRQRILPARSAPAVNSNGYLYVPSGANVDIFNRPTRSLPTVAYKPVTGPTTTAGTLNATSTPTGAAT